MVATFAGLFLSLVVISSSVYAVPLVLEKRIDQITSASTKKWEAACNAAGGDKQQCNSLAVAGFSPLLIAAGPCDQQNAADAMMDLSKQLNSADMIKFAQIYAQQPRNSPDSVAIPYCQQAPRNAELNGLFQCQFQGVNENTFAGNLKLGDIGTIPLGLSAPLNPLGSCPANPQGPVADGVQLTDITDSPGQVNGASESAPAQTALSPASTPEATVRVAVTATAAAVTVAAPAATASVPARGGFALQNGLAAQALNKQFATLSAESSCTGGENACINGSFAQCVGGKFAITGCSGGLSCFALPLVLSAGTSVTCDTEADALARIANTGATGGLTGA